MKKLGIIVNPFSGRDVRRVAARASTSDHHEKQRQVTRLALGALAQGADQIYLAHESFRINAKAVENLPVRDRVTLLKYPLTHSAEDTRIMARMMWDEGCRVFIVLGGDGTSRIVAKELPDAVVLPLSTGTNNVFPFRIEASVAGMAAGLLAAERLDPYENCIRCKRVHVEADQAGNQKKDMALIDAVLLRDDFIGSLLPFEASKIAALVLARAEPDSIGVSPIGGYLLPTGHEDDQAVLVLCDPDARQKINLPVSPGLHEDLGIKEARRLALGETVTLAGLSSDLSTSSGVLAFDGDRTIQLEAGQEARLKVLRDGPYIIDAKKIMRTAAEQGLFVK